jgi:hypothetical protein
MGQGRSAKEINYINGKSREYRETYFIIFMSASMADKLISILGLQNSTSSQV